MTAASSNGKDTSSKDSWACYIPFALILIYTVMLYGPMAAMSIGAGLLFALWLARVAVTRGEIARQDWKYLRASPMFLPTIAFTAACLWSVFWAKFTDLSFLGMKPSVELFGDSKKAWHLLFPLFLAPLFGDLSDRELRTGIRVWLWAGFAAAIMGILQFYFPIYAPVRLPHLDYENYKPAVGWMALFRGQYHATGFAAFHLAFASILAFPAAVWFGWLAVQFRRGGVNRKTLFVAGGCLAFFLANLLTYSKIAWVALPLTVILIALLGFKGWPRYALVAGILAFGAVWSTSSEVRLRFQGTDAIRARVNLWQATAGMIREHPFFGVAGTAIPSSRRPITNVRAGADFSPTPTTTSSTSGPPRELSGWRPISGGRSQFS